MRVRMRVRSKVTLCISIDHGITARYPTQIDKAGVAELRRFLQRPADHGLVTARGSGQHSPLPGHQEGSRASSLASRGETNPARHVVRTHRREKSE